MEGQGKTIWVINQFAGTPISGWGERHFYLAKGWVAKGYRVVIISSGNNHMFNNFAEMNGRFTHDEYEGVEFLWVKIPKYNPQNATRFLAMFFFAGVMWRLRYKTKLIDTPYYIIHSSMPVFPAPVVKWLKKRLGAKKFVFEVRDLWPLTPIKLMGYSPKHPFIRLIAWFEKYAYRNADEIVSLLNGSEKYINQLSGNPDKFNLVPNGIHQDLLLDRYKGEANDLKLPSNKLVVGYAGTVGFANALEEFFDMIEKHPELQDQVEFVILGDGYKKPEFQNQVGHLPHVSFIPKVKKDMVRSYINQFDVCFISWHPSELYQYGVSANKYFDFMAAAKPVLSANNGIQDPIALSEAGLCTDNKCHEILAALQKFLDMNSTVRIQMGNKGLQYIKENSTYQLLSDKYLAVLAK